MLLSPQQRVLAISNKAWADALWSYSGADGIISYFISGQSAKSGRRRTKISTKEQAGIEQALQQLDRITGLEFIQTHIRQESDIEFHKVLAYETPSISGETRKQAGWFEISWLDKGGKRLTNEERFVITHELGHAAGLDHPFGNGYDSNFSSSQTVMSYNLDGPAPLNYTELDQQALRAIWSVQVGPPPQ